LDEADEAYRKGEALGDRLLQLGAAPPEDFRSVATTYSDHAALLSNQGNPAKARPLFLKAIALQEPLCAKFPEFRYLQDLATMTTNLARVSTLLGRNDDALAACERARRLWSDLLARRPKDKFLTRMADEVAQQWTRAKVTQIDRLIKSGDHAG